MKNSVFLVNFLVLVLAIFLVFNLFTSQLQHNSGGSRRSAYSGGSPINAVTPESSLGRKSVGQTDRSLARIPTERRMLCTVLAARQQELHIKLASIRYQRNCTAKRCLEV